MTGRCYCGASVVEARGAPLAISYCHCQDCRRVTGAPVAAFAAFPKGSVDVTPEIAPICAHQGVRRWSCPTCGSPMLAAFDYLDGQVYVPLGILDNADVLAPQLHSHADACLPWLKLDDDLPREPASARDRLNARTDAP
ncbi:MAG: GFA family protein [Pseudomonadota bacterium]